MLRILFQNPFYSTKFNNFSLALIRISIGLFFLTTGYNKLFVEKNQQIMLDTIIHAGIPFPEVMAIFVSLLELGLGLLLTIGLLTQLSSLILIFICIVALVTVGIHTIPVGLDLITWISWFFYIHDLLYIFILTFILSKKPDFLTLDHFLFKKYM
ncbi:DoxX family membrane protein [Acinetobacter lactucae]|uniref:DoxX family membrane protein n=1 Tax=Acinetobacter lactucae TaxID=1785128 RepID=UPI00158006E6|nr:DoxX family membrane protein [Acinetobacter lactucae]NUF17114.1 DoxX family membrane protein [Acinetobacter lactucae]